MSRGWEVYEGGSYRAEGGISFYAYTKGNPINFTDPEGLRPTPFNGFCFFKYRDAKKACGAKFEEAREIFMDYLMWCECAWKSCKWGKDPCKPCDIEATVQDCQKFNKLNSQSYARISCVNNPEGLEILKYSADCIKKIALLIKCGMF